jgi:hypothetical protein
VISENGKQNLAGLSRGLEKYIIAIFQKLVNPLRGIETVS